MKAGAFIVTKEGDLVGIENTDRLDNANWFSRLFARVSRRYRNKLTYLEPIKTDFDLTYLEELQGSFEVKVPLNEEINKNNVIDEKFLKEKLNDKDPNKRWVIKD